MLCCIGGLGLWAGDAWLVPSLGSAIFVQALSPSEPSGKAWNTAMGQFSGELAGYLAVYAAGAAMLPSFMSGHPLDAGRLLAVLIAIVLTVLLQRALSATSPAGGATTILVALGTVPPTLHGAFLLAAGILLVTALGEPVRWLLLSLERGGGSPG